MPEPLNILVIEDSNADFLMVERHLKKNGLSVRCSRVDSLEGLKQALSRESWDLVLSDYNVPQLNFLASLSQLRAAFPDMPVIMVTGTVGEEKAVELLKLGVWDFVLKDNLARLVSAIEHCLKEASECKSRLAAEQALQKSEIQYRSIFNKSPVAIAIVKCDGGTLVSVNDAWLQLYGYERHEVIGRTATELNLCAMPGDRSEFVRLICEGGKVLNREIQLHTKTGEKLIALYSAELIELDGESFLQAMLTDITEQKRMENALRVSEERFQLAMQGANEGLWDWDVELDEVYYSPRWKSMLGYTDEELENHFDTWKRLVHPEDMEPALARVREFLEGRSSGYEGEYRMRHKEGHYLDILSRGFPVYDGQGKALRMVGTHEDITERKELEEQFRQSQKFEAIGQLAGGVAHDFNNILTAITGYSHLVLGKLNGNDPVQHYVEEIIGAAERAAALNQSLLAFSRKQTVAMAVIDLCDVVKKFEAFLRRLIREDIELKITCIDEPLAVLADRSHIEQVIMNLVANARDSMPNGGKLCIETMTVTLDQSFVEAHGYGETGNYALFSVSDTGEGMDKETKSRIFEPFFTTKEQGKGTGLGLSMAYGTIKKHDGFINVYSEPGRGTTFKIYLPRVQATAGAGNMESREDAASSGGTETILVGEDDATLRMLSTRVLSHYGYRVIEAVDGQDAVARFLEYGDSIHLVILDAVMPKKNGREAFDDMKRLRPDLKVIFTSGYARNIFGENCTFDDTTDFINKPYSPNKLVTMVREMLDKNK